MIAQVIAEARQAFDADTRSRILRKTPLGHLGSPQDVVYAVQFL
jgi:hypothetical protein